jgi:hypothetical protein
MQATFDYGSQFKILFADMCGILGIKHRPTKLDYDQGNIIIEIVHQVMGNVLRAFELEDIYYL